MAHLVNRRGYFSLEESYRDESGRPRKRVIEYWGKNYRKPISIFDIGWRESIMGLDEDRGVAAAERAAEKVDAEQRAAFGETGAERQDRERQEKAAALPSGLHLGPRDPVPVNKEIVQTEPATEAHVTEEQADPEEGDKGESAEADAVDGDTEGDV